MLGLKKPIVLVVISTLNIGGMEKHLLRVLPRLVGSYDITVYTTARKGKLAPYFEQYGIAVKAPPFADFFTKLGRLGCYTRYFISVFELCSLMLCLKPQVVHCFLPGAYVLGGFCAWVTRMPRCVMSRSSLNNYQKKKRLLAFFERRLHKKMWFVSGNCKAIVKQLEQEGVPKERLQLIYNGIDPAVFDALLEKNEIRRQYNMPENELYILLVANLHPYKGHYDLLTALNKIKTQLSEISPHWQLICIGRDMGGLKAKLMKYCRSVSLDEHVQWIGTCEEKEVVALEKSVDIGVLSSHEEGMPNAILECMACGLPMVVTDVGGCREAVNEDVGFVVPARAIDSLADRILRLAKDSQLRRAMGIAAKRRVLKEFSLESTVQSYHNLYANSLRSSNR